MRQILKRLKAWRRGRPDTEPDLDIVTPLVGILPEAEPRPELFAKIEASLDEDTSKESNIMPTRARLFLPFVTGVLVGLAITLLLAVAVLDLHGIASKSSADAPWMPLGAVTLHGADLRAFVRAKCKGHTHLSITLNGQSRPAHLGDIVEGTFLMDRGEVILMDCIF